MSWWKRDRKEGASVPEMVTEVNELLDSYHERTLVTDGDRAVVQPGKIIDNLKHRMERYAVDPRLETSIDEFIDVTEMEIMTRLGFGPLLITSAAEWAAELLHRELPAEWAGHPISDQFDLVEQSGGEMTLDPALQQIGRDLFNRATGRPRVGDETWGADLAGLLPEDLSGSEEISNIFATVLLLFLYKIAYAAQARQPDIS